MSSPVTLSLLRTKLITPGCYSWRNTCGFCIPHELYFSIAVAPDKGSVIVSEGSVVVNNTYNSFIITKAGHDMIWEINPGKNSKHIFRCVKSFGGIYTLLALFCDGLLTLEF